MTIQVINYEKNPNCLTPLRGTDKNMSVKSIEDIISKLYDFLMQIKTLHNILRNKSVFHVNMSPFDNLSE